MRNLLKKIPHPETWLEDEASIAAIVYFVLVIFLSLFMYIGIGAVIDRMLGANEILMANLDSTVFPASQNRVETLGYLTMAVQWFPWLGALLPLMIYTFVVSKRRQSGQVA